MRRIGDFTLRQLARQYEDDIFKDFFPFLDKHVVDHKLGGFMTNVDRDGTLLKTTKNTWYCGRGIWCYSFLYNNFKKNLLTSMIHICPRTLQVSIRMRDNNY